MFNLYPNFKEKYKYSAIFIHFQKHLSPVLQKSWHQVHMLFYMVLFYK